MVSHVVDRRTSACRRIVKGMDVVHRINKLPVIAANRHKLTHPCTIVDCGELKRETDEADEADKEPVGATGGVDTRSSLEKLEAKAAQEEPLLQEAPAAEVAAARVEPLSAAEDDGIVSVEVDD